VSGFVNQACASDDALRREVVSLLVAAKESGPFLDAPPDVSAALGALIEQETSRVPSLIGVTLSDRYIIIEELAQGGFATVYLARDQNVFSKAVVVKVLREGVDCWFRKKFQQEIESLSRIDHPGVVGIIDSGETPDNRPFLVEQFVEGVSLRQHIRPEGMHFEHVTRLMQQIGAALDAAHDNGIIHCDLKPENIMVQELSRGEERARIVDFGIAKIKESQVNANQDLTKVAGSPRYMAPEQVDGHPSAASDIWALGVISYEMVTGRCPFNPSSHFQIKEILKAGVRVKPIDLRPDLPEKAQAVILKALSFEPQNRYQRASDFANKLTSAFLVRRSFQRRDQKSFAVRWRVAALLILAFLFGLDTLIALKLMTGRSDNAEVIRQLEPIGGTGWVFLGYYDEERSIYIDGPYYEIAQSNYTDHSDIPRIGEGIRLEKKDRSVVIVDFAQSGQQLRFDPPLADLDDNDYTKVRLKVGTVVKVRDVSVTHFPGRPYAVWARISSL